LFPPLTSLPPLAIILLNPKPLFVAGGSYTSVKQTPTMEAITLPDTMSLKISELLKEVHLQNSSSFTKLVEDTVSAIRESINQIPEDFKVTAKEARGFVRDIGADKAEFKFKRPSHLELGGSYSINCIARPETNVDLLLRLPKECFNEKDYLNHRYHAKRFLYLCVIKKFLKSSSSISKVEWSTFQNEARKPVLDVYPAASTPEFPGFFVRIIPTAKSLFNVSKLGLRKNNIRALQDGSTPVPTPRYNSSILEDMSLEENSEFLRNTFTGWNELGEALILLKVWARHRSSVYAHDGLNGFLLAIILSYLAAQSKVNKSMRPLHMFRVTLDFIGNSKLWGQGIYFRKHCDVKLSKEDRMIYKELFPVVLCDPQTPINLTYRISRIAFSELREEAALTLQCLGKVGDGAFEDIFATNVDFPSRYDHCIRLNLKGNSEVSSSGFCLDDECWRLYEQKVHNILSQGLGDRAKSVRVIWRNISSGCRLEKGLSALNQEPLIVGVSVSSLEEAYRVVDIGPNAEDKDAALKFRKFWGEKAELRRFKDGRIAESTVWEANQWTKHLILKRIVEHVLVRHLSISETNITQIVDQLDFSLLHGASDPISFYPDLCAAFDVLEKRLRLIEDIPLKISHVQSLDPALRATSVFPPEPHPLAIEKGSAKKLSKLTSSCIQPLEVMIQLEGSANWPKDEVAIEKTKSAFLLKIGESLESNWKMTCNATEDDVVIFLKGYAFRLNILHDRALTLVNSGSGSQRAKQVCSADKRIFLQSQHSSIINGVQRLYPAYGPVVRLAKRWVAAHLFSACLTDEAVELLVAHLFVNPLPFKAPSSRLTGFLRFLRLLAEYDWSFSALVVDINNDLSPSDKEEIEKNFLLSRKGYEGNMQNVSPAMFLATPYDKASVAWTSSLNTMELKRLVAYARSSATLLTKLVLQDENDSSRWECILRTPFNNYDAVVLLHADKLPFPRHLLFPSAVNQGRVIVHGNATKSFAPFFTAEDFKGNLQQLKDKLLVDFNPLRCYVTDLKEFSTVKLWYDALGGDAIGLTWKRSGSKKRLRDEKDDEDEGDDPVDILKAVGEAGKGLVKSVHLVKVPRLTA
ncbi:Nucleolar protein 6, partial [Linum perenne]